MDILFVQSVQKGRIWGGGGNLKYAGQTEISNIYYILPFPPCKTICF